MTDTLILHHYQASPFSEKIRRILAYKQAPWTSVRAPAVMPKPELVALTGGYRKIPVLQIGNHVYCDTALIAREIDARHPSPPLYPSPILASLAEWADTVLFEATTPLILRPTKFEDLLAWLTQDELTRIVDDRRALRSDAVQPSASPSALRQRFEYYAARIDGSLAHAPYLFGGSPCIADFSVYHALWLISHTAPDALAPYPNLCGFIERLEALADPVITNMTAEAALEVCKGSPVWQAPLEWTAPAKLEAGQYVHVRASDYGRDPVQGTLVFASDNELVLQREDHRAGTVYVHFPRVGYDVAAVAQ